MSVISSIFIDLKCAIIDELKSLFSDSGALLLLVFATMIYTTIYSIAYGSEVVRDVPIAVVDNDNTAMSRELIKGVEDGPDTRVAYETESLNRAKQLFYEGEIFGILHIPNNYERTLLAGEQANVSLMIDGTHLMLYSHIMQQGVADVLTAGAEVEVSRLMKDGTNAATIPSLVEAISHNANVLYNPNMGYGSFVMPSILIVIIQQTLIIGLALMAARRRERGAISATKPIISVLSKILVYTMIYGINLTIILGIIWQIFDFPNMGSTTNVVILLLIYMVSATTIGIATSHLFTRRESPLMLLLWSSIPILLIAGVSYPYEALPEWLYTIGRILPSSSAVDAFIEINSMGASLEDVLPEITTLLALAAIYLTCAIIVESRLHRDKTIA